MSPLHAFNIWYKSGSFYFDVFVTVGFTLNFFAVSQSEEWEVLNSPLSVRPFISNPSSFQWYEKQSNKNNLRWTLSRQGALELHSQKKQLTVYHHFQSPFCWYSIEWAEWMQGRLGCSNAASPGEFLFTGLDIIWVHCLNAADSGDFWLTGLECWLSP